MILKGIKKSKRVFSGLSIRAINFSMVIIAVLLFALLLYATVNISKRRDSLEQASNDYIEYQEKANLIAEGSDYLTEQVRLFAMTGELRYARSYFTEVNETKRRDRALEAIVAGNVDSGYNEYVETALDASNELMTVEVYSMKLICEAYNYDQSLIPDEVKAVTLSTEDAALSSEEKIDKAQEELFDSYYQNEKNYISSNIDTFLSNAMRELQNRQVLCSTQLDDIILFQRILITITFVVSILYFIAIFMLVIIPLRKYMLNMQNEESVKLMGASEIRYLGHTYNTVYRKNQKNATIIREQVGRDPLTGLADRGAFNKMANSLRGTDMNMALIIVDVDEFKAINDNDGHMTGDKTLKKLGSLLSENFRIADMPARIGGDEFAVIMTNITPSQKRVITDKIDNVVNEMKNGSDGVPSTTLSIGAAFSSRGYNDYLYKKADRALYYVKQRGRDGFEFYNNIY